jgi:hypothetical protein
MDARDGCAYAEKQMGTDAAERVREENERFRKALPELLETYPNRWVVFRDGAVISDHDSQLAAYTAAVEAFGPHGGFVVAPVKEQVPTPMTAAVLFGK